MARMDASRSFMTLLGVVACSHLGYGNFSASEREGIRPCRLSCRIAFSFACVIRARS